MDELKNLRARHHIISALIFAVENIDRVVEVCAMTSAVGDEVTRVLADAFGFTTTQAQSVLAMQVCRFTPHEVAKLRGELAEIEERIAQ